MEIDFSKEIQINQLTPKTEFEEKVISFLKDWYSNSTTVSVQTSGSTGKPKIFEVEKEKMLNSAKMTCDFLNLKQGDSAILCLPVEYISGKMMLVRSIERKLKLQIFEPNSKPIDNLNSEINFCAMSPLQVENSIQKIHFIENLIIGGAQISETLKNKIKGELNSDHSTSKKSQIFETYGMSETLSHIALKQIYPNTEEYFKAFNGVEISLDEKGCLNILAPNLNSNQLKTNDLVELKNEKEFKFLGRWDNVINSGGLKIYPEELENLLKKKISNELVFIGKKDELFGQKLMLIVEGKETTELKKNLSEIVYPTKNHRPKEIVFIENFPRIPNGKIDRQKITEFL